MSITDILIPLITIPALWMLGNKNKWAFWVLNLGNIVWIYTSVINKNYGAVFTLLFYSLFNIRNFIKWKKEEI